MAVSLGRDSSLYLCLIWTQNPPDFQCPAPSLTGQQCEGNQRPSKQAGGTCPSPGTQQSPSMAPWTRVPKESTATTQACGAECGAASLSQPGLPASQLTSCLPSQPNSSFRIINSAAQEKSSLPGQG